MQSNVAPQMERPVGARVACSGKSDGATQRLVTAGNGAQNKMLIIVLKPNYCQFMNLNKRHKKVPNFRSGLLVCGERGIRTPGPVTVNSFQDYRNRPLCHLSKTAIVSLF